MRGTLTRQKPLLTFVCGAGVTHHGTEKQVRKWRNDEILAARLTSEKTVKAHDDYMAAMRLFRHRAQDVLTMKPDATDLSRIYQDGYKRAIRDMDRALLDVMQHRFDEEIDPS